MPAGQKAVPPRRTCVTGTRVWVPTTAKPYRHNASQARFHWSFPHEINEDKVRHQFCINSVSQRDRPWGSLKTRPCMLSATLVGSL